MTMDPETRAALDEIGDHLSRESVLLLRERLRQALCARGEARLLLSLRCRGGSVQRPAQVTVEERV